MAQDAPRRSSTGTRRGPPKPHVPYRGENYDVAKKTGVQVQRADVDSDGFEPFEDVVRQADTLTPFQVKGKGKKRKESLPEEDLVLSDDDGGGEEDMDIDSPMHYIANVRQPTSPIIPRVSSSRSRAVSRTTNDFYDAIPSPHRSSTSRLARGDAYSAGTSRLSLADTSINEEGYSMDMSMTNGAIDYPAQTPSPQSRSFNDIENDDEEDGDEEEERTPVPPASSRNANWSEVTPTPKNIGKGKQVAQEDEEEEENDPLLDLNDMGNDVDEPSPYEDDPGEQEEEEEDSRAKKQRVAEPSKEKVIKKPKQKVQSTNLKENYTDGVRRSQRKSYKPLQYWRNEKVIYGRPSHKDGQILVPHIKEIVRIPEEPVEPLSKKRKRTTKSRSRPPDSGQAQSRDPNDFPEKGWDDDTMERGQVIDWRTRELVEKRLACLSKNVTFQEASNSAWQFQKIFGDEQFIAAGQLVIPEKGRKPSKPTRDNTYVFCILEGAVNVKINEENSMILCQGAMFMVPRGNQYFIENISDRPARLFFTQARMVTADRDTVSPQKPAAPNSTAGTSSMVRAATSGGEKGSGSGGS
ncbi:centromeric dna binding protein [Moniliophthora roreri MCA 2997]|uniref:Centromeric dna binding protein n=2 Tax=Moniliophthora roreri TaxID=221103 RepID=V2WUZ8_MONRO|nr:centromeric dna binding protein [Moniliophthora roreri MCA 2997]KAI3620981.1 centromeric dna binding protein [Moniliophthora roreri]